MLALADPDAVESDDAVETEVDEDEGTGEAEAVGSDDAAKPEAVDAEGARLFFAFVFALADPVTEVLDEPVAVPVDTEADFVSGVAFESGVAELVLGLKPSFSTQRVSC